MKARERIFDNDTQLRNKLPKDNHERVLPKMNNRGFLREDYVQKYNEVIKHNNLDKKRNTSKYAFFVEWQNQE